MSYTSGVTMGIMPWYNSLIFPGSYGESVITTGSTPDNPDISVIVEEKTVEEASLWPWIIGGFLLFALLSGDSKKAGR